jgi:hypothetical protein
MELLSLDNKKLGSTGDALGNGRWVMSTEKLKFRKNYLDDDACRNPDDEHLESMDGYMASHNARSVCSRKVRTYKI